MLADQSVRDLLAAFSSSAPTPGGGSASALASAIGASLLLMVAALPKTRSGSEEEDRSALASAGAALAGLRDQLTDAIDGDAAAYDQVVAAYKLPKASSEEQLARKAAIQRALLAATNVPLGVMRLSSSALEWAATVAVHGHRAAASDVGVAVALLRAGLQGAGLNIEINAGSVTDAVYVEAAKAEAARLSERAGQAADAAEASLGLTLG
jgi:methenyltetrahydrofolate cyclohydrolase